MTVVFKLMTCMLHPIFVFKPLQRGLLSNPISGHVFSEDHIFNESSAYVSYKQDCAC
jgi:hypothetical protein